jgi:uncharacterized protein YndB with AHSA1/START domain
VEVLKKGRIKDGGHILVIVRSFSSPPPRIFQAWTNPDELAKWWGPEGFTVPLCKIDFRIGGEYHICMRSPEGADFWSKGTFIEIVATRKIVAMDSFSDAAGNIIPAASVGLPGEWPSTLLITATFEDRMGGTLFTLRHERLPLEMLESCRAGWNESLDKLHTHLGDGGDIAK